MNLFKNFTMTWWQAAIFKVSIVCLGISIGSNWPAFFAPLTWLWLTLAAVTGLYLVSLWSKQ